jgi:methyl-accepting chemotaxis protein
MIDRLMSRIRIQTKVLILVTPFVMSIAAVGLTGLYASSQLQGRIDISNSVMQALSGFKQVYSAMSLFLMQPSKATYDGARGQLDSQIKDLKVMAENMRGQTDVAELDTAIGQSATLFTNLDRLWSLQQETESTSADVVARTEELMAVQAAIGKQAFVLMTSAKTVEKAAKSGLNTALLLTTLPGKAELLAAQVSKSATPADSVKALSAGVPDVKAAIATAKKALGKVPAPAVDALQTALDALETEADRLKADPLAVPAIEPIVTKIQAASQEIKAFSDGIMRTSVASLAASDALIGKADKVGNKLRAIVNYANQIRVTFAELAAKPNDANVKLLQQGLYAYGKEIDGLMKAVPEETAFAAFPPKANQALKAMETDGLAMVDQRAKQRSEFDVAAKEIDAMWGLLAQFAERQKESAGTERKQANSISVGATVTGILVAMLAGAVLVMTLKGPIGQITAAMRRLADGALDTAVTGEGRSDEIGDMARALSVFKQSALAKLSMEERAEITRHEADEERQLNERQRQEAARETEFAVATLAQGLSRLSGGDISFTIDTPFAPHLDRVRHDFNASVAGLRDTLTEVHGLTDTIHDNGNQMAGAVGDLAHRTEKQAAALEETSAALAEVSSTVATAAVRSNEVRTIVQQAKSRAETSSTTVQNAVDAMLRIKDASQKIGQIVGVIDTIAFQTNLLALNAGVEAARAGEAGRGFAVVAQEVRELAQRSATAAKEIGQLIRRSSDEVTAGSRFVQDTGDVLTEISGQIIGIASHVDLIAASGQEQSGTLRAINGSVNELDHMTQQNAAMVEETNAATQQLAEDIAALTTLLSRFRLTDDRSSAKTRHAA